METWRIVAVALFAVAGLVLLPVVMAKARDRTGRSATVALAGAVTLAALLVLGVLMVTVLPGVLTWVITAATASAVIVMLLAS